MQISTTSKYTRFIGKRIKTLRKEMGLSKYRLAKLARCEPTEITNYEKGIVKASGERLNDIFKALGQDYIPTI